jgi:hypothetical protein
MTTLYVDNIAPNLASRVSVPGHVIQVVQDTSTTTQNVNSSTFTAVTDLSVSITPSSMSSKILVFVSLAADAYQAGTQEVSTFVRLIRGSTAITSKRANHYTGVSGNGYYSLPAQSEIVYLDSPSSTDSLTYTAEVKVDTTDNQKTYRLSTGGGESTITLMEIAQ